MSAVIAVEQDPAGLPATYAEIGEALGVDRSSVLRRAAREGWQDSGQRRLIDRVWVMQFTPSTLPQDVQRALAKHRWKTAAAPPATAPAGPAPEPTGQSDAHRQRDEAVRAIWAEIDRRVAEGATQNQAIDALVDLSRRGGLPEAFMELVRRANARAGDSRTLSRPSLLRWKRELRETGACVPKAPEWTGWPRLVLDLWPQSGGVEAVHARVAEALAQRGERAPGLDQVRRFVVSEIRPWAPAFLSLWQRPTEPSVALCLEELPEYLDEGCPLPSIHQCRRFVDGLDPIERNKGRKGPMALLALKPFKRRDADIFEPLSIVTADGHTFKAWVRHPVNPMKTFCPEVVTVEDATTRYVFGWSIGLAESTWVVMDAIRHAIGTLGTWSLFYTDNGCGFVNDCMTADVLGMLARAGITHDTSTPGRAQSRGRIERLQGSCLKRAARKLVTYRGRDMDREAAKAVEKRINTSLKTTGELPKWVMPWEEFRDWLGQEIALYNGRPHGALPLITDPETGKRRHQSPQEALQGAIDAGWEPTMLPPAVTDDLFRPYEQRKVVRGEVSLPWGRYFSQALEFHHGEMVRVGYDIHDGAKVWVRDQDGRLLAIAERDGNVIPHHPVSAVEAAKDKRLERRLKLLDQHADDALLERTGPRIVDATWQPSAADLVKAEETFAALEAGVPPKPQLRLIAPTPAVENATPEPLPPETSARPIFRDVETWAHWVMANPDRATEADQAELKRRMESVSFRLLMGLEDDE